MKNLKLQYQLSNGSWIDCGDRTEEFLELCTKHNGMDAEGNIQPRFRANRDLTRGEAVEALISGVELRNDQEDWYSVCRSEIPVIKKQEQHQLGAEKAHAEKIQNLTNEKCHIYLNVVFSEKENAKAHGAKWNPHYKMWYYPSEAGEYLPEGLKKYDQSKTTSEENYSRFSETGLDWYDR